MNFRELHAFALDWGINRPAWVWSAIGAASDMSRAGLTLSDDEQDRLLARVRGIHEKWWKVTSGPTYINYRFKQPRKNG